MILLGGWGCMPRAHTLAKCYYTQFVVQVLSICHLSDPTRLNTLISCQGQWLHLFEVEVAQEV